MDELENTRDLILYFRGAMEHPPNQSVNEFQLDRRERRLRVKFLIFWTGFFFLTFFKVSSISPVQSNSTLSTISTNDSVQTIGQYIRYAFLRIDNLVFLSISAFLIGLFSILNKYEQRDDGDEQSSILLLFPSFPLLSEGPF